MERLFEELGEQEEGGASVKSIAIMGNKAAAAAGEAVLLEDCDGESGFGKACCGCYAAYSCACITSVSSVEGNVG